MLKFRSEHSLKNCGAIGCLKLDVLRFFGAMSYELGPLVEHLLNAFINTLATLEGLADNTCLHILS
jgi:hypothetical protein